MSFVLAFGMFMVATPSQAEACYGGGCYNYTYYNPPRTGCYGTCNSRVYQPPVYQPPVYQPPVYQQPPVYYPPVNYYQPLTVSCSANTASGNTGSAVTWSAYASGGNGSYTYSWTGSDGIYGS